MQITGTIHARWLGLRLISTFRVENGYTQGITIPLTPLDLVGRSSCSVNSVVNEARQGVKITDTLGHHLAYIGISLDDNQFQ